MTRQVPDDVKLSISQLIAAWQLMCRDCPTPTMETADGIDYVFSNIPVAFFNVAVLTPRTIAAPALRALGEQAVAWAADKPVPWFFVLTHEAVAPGTDAMAILDDCGLAPALPLTGMWAQHVSPPARLPNGLDLVVPGDDAACAAILDVNSAAYEMDLGPVKPVLGRHRFWADQAAVLGQVDGTAASSAAVLIVDGVRYVALVATDPAHQRRGYADAAMRRALDVAAAAHGELPTVLHATDAGRPVYERMGYSPIATHTLLMEKRYLEGH